MTEFVDHKEEDEDAVEELITKASIVGAKQLTYGPDPTFLVTYEDTTTQEVDKLFRPVVEARKRT